MQLKENVTPDDHSQGPEDAKVTLVEYGDYQCSDCGSAYPVVKRLEERFGKVLRFTFRNFPLAEAHPMAESAAEAAEYAATKGKFWQMHGDLYEHQTQLSIELLATLATKNEPDAGLLTEALVQQTFQKLVITNTSESVAKDGPRQMSGNPAVTSIDGVLIMLPAALAARTLRWPFTS